MAQVTDFEHMLREDGIGLIKFWFSISKEERKNRCEARLQNPLKQWKFSPVDMKGQELWNKYTQYKERMFAQTHTNFSPWIIVQANNKRVARLESMRYVLSQFDYKTRREPRVTITPDPNIISRYFRDLEQIDI